MARLHRGNHHHAGPGDVTRTRILQKIRKLGGIEMLTHRENDFDY